MSVAAKLANWLQSKPSVRYSTEIPSAQNVVDIFAGEWWSVLPNGLEGKPGTSALFNDARIRWLNSQVRLRGKTILELGPLEAAHTYMMQMMGAKSVIAVEANERAYLKCLCVKELFGLDRTSFLHGDLMRYLEATTDAFDLIVASGVLYHMTEPLKLLSLLCKKADRIFIWTHYFDSALRGGKLSGEFSNEQTIEFEGKKYHGSKRLYPATALRLKEFAGGPSRYSIWLTRNSILRFFEDEGFKYTVKFEERKHPHGPCFAIVAIRPHAIESGVPDDFDPAIYLAMHEDVAASEMDPELHYREFGELEGRPYKR